MGETPNNVSVAEHLSQAKKDIAAGDNSLRSAAEHIAAAIAAGATQSQAAHTVGKSQPWVNRLLQWKEGGFKQGGPFADDNAKAKISRTNNSVQLNCCKPDRDLLVKCLGMLGSNKDGEVVNAARQAEQLRIKLGLSWQQLIVKVIKSAEVRAAIKEAA